MFLTCNHFAVIYKNKAESLFTSLPPFIIIEDLRIYRVFFTHSLMIEDFTFMTAKLSSSATAHEISNNKLWDTPRSPDWQLKEPRDNHRLFFTHSHLFQYFYYPFGNFFHSSVSWMYGYSTMIN